MLVSQLSTSRLGLGMYSRRITNQCRDVIGPSNHSSKRSCSESQPTHHAEERRKESGQFAGSSGLEASRYYDYAQYPTSSPLSYDTIARHHTPAGHYTHGLPPHTQIRMSPDGCTQEELNRTPPLPPLPPPPQNSATSRELWSHRERVRSISFSLPPPVSMELRTNNYDPRRPDELAPGIADISTFRLLPYGEGSSRGEAKSPTSSPRGSKSALKSLRESFRDEGNQSGHEKAEYSRYHDHLVASKDPYRFGPTTYPPRVPSGGGPHGDNLSDIPRAVGEVGRLSAVQRTDETEYTREPSSDKPRPRLPPISFLLCLSMAEATNILQRRTNEYDGAPFEIWENQENTGNRGNRENGQPLNNSLQTLPPPHPLEPSSAAGYSKPAGAMLRPRCTPISICKSTLESGSSLCRCSSTQVERPPPGFITDRNSLPEVNEERQYPNPRPGMRHGQRQTMSEAEKRARKALQQQRRRKHGPTREPRERFSVEEDTWLVMEKRRLEKEPNKHWTDLEYAHKAKFPNLKDRTLSGLQSRYYRIKKKYPVDPTSPGGSGGPSRWDAEVEGRFSEGADSDGDIEDFEVRDASAEGDLNGYGAERI